MAGFAIAVAGDTHPRRPAAARAALTAVVAEATAYATNIPPAQDAFEAADEAWVSNKDPNRDDALGTTKYELENIWLGHLDHFFAIAERALKLPADTREALKANITAYAELLDPIVGEREYATPLERLPKESLLTVIDHLINQHAGVMCRRPSNGAA